MQDSLRDSQDAERARYRPCVECGAPMHVTYLIPKRVYACAKCGFPFLHHPAIGSSERKQGQPRSRVLRLVPLMAVAALVPFVLPLAFAFEVEGLRISAVAVSAALLTLVGAGWVGRKSRDPAGSISVMLTMAGFASLALLFIREIGGQSPEEVAKLEWRLTFAAFAMIGIGAFNFARFVRNRSNLVRVDAEGKVSRGDPAINLEI